MRSTGRSDTPSFIFMQTWAPQEGTFRNEECLEFRILIMCAVIISEMIMETVILQILDHNASKASM